MPAQDCYKDSPESSHGLLEEYSHDYKETVNTGRREAKHGKIFQIILLILLALSLALNCFLLFSSSSSGMDGRAKSKPTYSSYSSPMEREIDMRLRPVDYNGSFYKQTIFREDPSPEVDEAWISIGAKNVWIALSEEEGVKSGLRKNYNAKLSDGGGDEFIGNIEGLHHLHCLNMIRQTAYFNYEYYRDRKIGAFVDPDDMIKTHTTHCIDILRQALSCRPDLGIFGQVWVNSEKGESGKAFAFPDFNRQHKCRNHDAMIKWVDERALPQDVKLVRFQNDFVHENVP